MALVSIDRRLCYSFLIITKNIGGRTLFEKITYEGRANCYRIYDELIELIVPTDSGPGILHFGFVGQKNEFKNIQGFSFFAHRLSHAPEMHPRSHIPDTDPITFKQHDTFIRLTKPTEAGTGIQKEMDIPISPVKDHISITHRLYNHTPWPVELAPWAISNMMPGGKAIIPLPPRQPSSMKNLLPTSLLAIWEYSNLSDSRLKIEHNFIVLRQDKNAAGPLKIGVMDSDGWTAYWNGNLFVKTFDYKKGASYPDFGCSVEVYSAKENLELETLAPFKILQPGESVEYVEQWFLFRDVPEPLTDADVDMIAKHVLPPIKA
jgi:hypothetical protein